MDIIITNDKNQVLTLVDNGYVPVECSIGGESIVDDLKMDHHGDLSALESVAVRAYRDHYGACEDNPKFVGVGVADADMTFAAAALAGILPHPECKKASTLAPHLAAPWKKDLSGLAKTIGTLDTDPIGRNPFEMPGGDILKLWQSIAFGARDSAAAVHAVLSWAVLTTTPERVIRPLINGVRESEDSRKAIAREDMKGALDEFKGEKVMALPGTRVYGFDVWYSRLDVDGDPGDPKSWDHPVVLALADGTDNITVGCPNRAVSEALFGEGGLKNVFPKLEPDGWGGREAIGGSPRGQRMTEDDLREAANAVKDAIK